MILSVLPEKEGDANECATGQTRSSLMASLGRQYQFTGEAASLANRLRSSRNLTKRLARPPCRFDLAEFPAAI
jgi:hypothetical protein